MHHLFTQSLLLADRSLLRDMGSGFRDKREHQGGADMLMWMLIVVGVFVAIAIVAHFVARRDKRQIYNSPRGLFRALCRAHQLDFGSRRLLRQIAREQQLDLPALLFVEPEHFEPENLGLALTSRSAEITALRRRLFATDEPRGPRLGMPQPAPIAAVPPTSAVNPAASVPLAVLSASGVPLATPVLEAR